MQLLSKRSLRVTGVGLLASAFIIPFAPAASAASSSESKADLVGGNAAVDVQTELNCTNHTLTARVTNKTGDEISPDVTFNKLEPMFDNPTPIKPGETMRYYFGYSGNNLPAEVKVSVDTFKPVVLDPMLNCDEPVSFLVTDASEHTIAGYLTNNSSFVSQLVMTQANGQGIQTENLEPNESAFVSMPYQGSSDQRMVILKIGNSQGFQSTYSIDLDNPQGMPPVPLPLSKKE